ncbi:MAG: hypothetical protein LBS37_09165 [Treponema sp.]|jgi:hypothetical protein|nr:hypothetical protein [Treponema sp.]
MKNSTFFVSGMAALLLTFVFALTGCPTGGGGDGSTSTQPTQEGISTPEVIDGYYGVTNDGKTIKIVITSPGSTGAGKAIDWSKTNNYTAYVDGKVVSRGTVIASGGSIEFKQKDGGAVNITGDAITITDGGTTYSGSVTAAKDYYYCIGSTTTYTESQINSLFTGQTPEQIYNYCSTTGSYNFDYPDVEEGNWEDMKAFGKQYGCPDSVVSDIAKKLNDTVSAWGYYHSAQYNSNIMFYIARVPLM